MHAELNQPRAFGDRVHLFLGEGLRGRSQLNSEVAVGNDSDLERAAGDLSRGCADGCVHDGYEARAVVRCKGCCEVEGGKESGR